MRSEPLTPDADPTPVIWHLRLRVARWQSAAVRAEVSIRAADGGSGYQSASRSVQLCPERRAALHRRL